MKLLNGFLLLLVFQCLGEALKLLLQLSVPGPVLGMGLLFALLCWQGTIDDSLIRASQTLIPMLALMFMPAATGLFFLGAGFADQWPAILGAVVIGTALSLLCNALLMRALTSKRP